MLDKIPDKNKKLEHCDGERFTIESFYDTFVTLASSNDHTVFGVGKDWKTR